MLVHAAMAYEVLCMRPIMSDWLRWRARATPHKLAVLSGGRSVSYAELERLADRLAAGLTARGVQAGDRVAMSLGNSLEAIALIHAVARVRAVLVPLNNRLTAAERGRQIDMVEPTLLAVDKEPTAEDEGEAKGGATARDRSGLRFEDRGNRYADQAHAGCRAHPEGGQRSLQSTIPPVWITATVDHLYLRHDRRAQRGRPHF